MKTTPDGWPVYEDTGEIVELGPSLILLDGKILKHVVPEAILKPSSNGGLVARYEYNGTAWNYDTLSLFRHPHNAAAAWLKAVSEPTKESQ